MGNYSRFFDGETETKNDQSKAVLQVEFQLSPSLTFLFYI